MPNENSLSNESKPDEITPVPNTAEKPMALPDLKDVAQQTQEAPFVKDETNANKETPEKEKPLPISEKPEIPLIIPADIIQAGETTKTTGQKTVTNVMAQIEKLGNLP